MSAQDPFYADEPEPVLFHNRHEYVVAAHALARQGRSVHAIAQELKLTVTCVKALLAEREAPRERKKFKRKRRSA